MGKRGPKPKKRKPPKIPESATFEGSPLEGLNLEDLEEAGLKPQHFKGDPTRDPDDGRFLPGHCPNPKGRGAGPGLRIGMKKGWIPLTVLLKAALARANEDEPDKSNAEIVVEQIINHAVRGDPRHMIEILNRVEGKVPDALTLRKVDPIDALTDDQLDAIILANKDAEVEVDDASGDTGREDEASPSGDPSESPPAESTEGEGAGDTGASEKGEGEAAD